MKTAILVALLMTCPMIAAPVALAEPANVDEGADGGSEPDPVCWELDDSKVPPVWVYVC